MNYLADSNLWLRYSQPADPQFPAALHALSAVAQRKDVLHLVPQTVSEYWRVATGTVRGGFGWTPAQAESRVAALEGRFPLLPDTPDVYQNWRRIVRDFAVSGGQVYDARLVAAMLTHSMTHLVMFNTADFTRYASLGIVALHPQDV